MAVSLSPAAAQNREIAIASQGGVHLLMRHAAAPGTGDPDNFRIGDCGTQRNLSPGGGAQARLIGGQLTAARVLIDVTLTSQWCRSQETARLLNVAPIEEAPFLNSFFEDRSTSEEQSAAVIERLQALDAAGQKAILVTHQVNITALTGVYPASGEIVLVTVDEDGEIVVRGRLRL